METRRPTASPTQSLEHRHAPSPDLGPSPDRGPWLPRVARSTSVLVLALAVAMPEPSRAQPMTGQSIIVEIEDLRNEQGEVLAGLSCA